MTTTQPMIFVGLNHMPNMEKRIYPANKRTKVKPTVKLKLKKILLCDEVNVAITPRRMIRAISTNGI